MNVFAFASRNWLPLLLAAAVLYLSAARFTSDRAKAAEAAAREAQFNMLATKLGAAVAEQKSAHDIAAGLSEKNSALVAALQKADKDSKIVQHDVSTVTIHDTVEGTLTPATWDDAYHRFHLNLTTGVFTREQKFRLEGVVVEGPDGKTKVRGVTFDEIDPKTGTVIPNSGATVDTKFEVVKETPPVSMFHPRVLAVVGSGGYGLGYQFMNLQDRFDLAAVALYAPATKAARLGPAVTWRVKLPFLDTNLGVGPTYLYDTSKGNWSFGGAVTIELTR